MKTLIVQNYWTPYRNDLFEALSKSADIEVLYLGKVGADRKWSREEGAYPVHFVPSRKFGPFLLNRLNDFDFSRFDRLVILEHLENIFSILKIISRFPKGYFLWSGMYSDMYPDKRIYGGILDVFKKIYRHRLYRAERYLAYSSLTREMFLKAGVPDEKITILHQASRIRELPEIQRQDPVELRKNRTGPLRVLSLGYLRREKNNRLLIRVCGKFPKEELILTIVGDGPEKKKLESMGFENVVFKGYLDGDEKFREYLDADVFVLPTIRDPWALVVNEAMYYGLPVIGSTRAGSRDVVSEENGFLVDPCNPRELEEALRKLVSSRPLCLSMGRKSREIIQKYTINYAAGQLSALLNRKGE